MRGRVGCGAAGSNDGFPELIISEVEALLSRARDDDPDAKAELARRYEAALAHERQARAPALDELLTREASGHAGSPPRRRRATPFWQRLRQADVRSLLLRECPRLLKEFGVGALESFSPVDIEKLAGHVRQGDPIATEGLRRLIRAADLDREARRVRHAHLPDVSFATSFPSPEETPAHDRRRDLCERLDALKPLIAAHDPVADRKPLLVP